MAREGAAIASALDRAAQALQANRAAHDPLRQVLKAIQPLRGLAALDDLPPLPDVLEGIERAVAEVSGSGAAPPPQVGQLFQAAATAVARSAREVAERGRPDPEGAEFQKFAGLLLKLGAREPEVASIASLYYDDSGPHIVNRGAAPPAPPAPATFAASPDVAAPPTRPAGLGRLELVSQGEHLRQAADSLERAQSVTQRELRAHTLASTFRALAHAAGGGILGAKVAQLAAAVRDALASGVAVHQPAAFAAELRRMGDVLARTGAGGVRDALDEPALAAELDPSIERVQALSRPPAAPVAPIESPMVTPHPRSPVPPDEPVPETLDLVGSWVAYQRQVEAEETGIGPASLEELIAAAGRAPPSRDTGRPARTGPAPASPPSPRAAALPGAPATVEPMVVDVRTLLYRGERALQRARELREVAKQAPGDALRGLVEEVCDLVALALESHA